MVTVPADRDRTTAAEMKKRYGEITALDFPQWTKDNFPGVTKMDLRSALFGDVSDDAMRRATPSIRPPPPANAGSTSSPTSS